MYVEKTGMEVINLLLKVWQLRSIDLEKWFPK
jgi:hypothetical protein